MATVDDIKQDYEEELEASIALAIDGQLTMRQLTAELVRLSGHYLAMMYAAGGGDINSAKGKRYLQQQARIHRRSASRLARDVFNGKYNGDNG
jgi:hypothetical protein